MVDGLACFLEKRAEFELINGHLFMSGFNWNSNFEQLPFGFRENLLDDNRKLAVVVIRELLVLRRDVIGKCSTATSYIKSFNISAFWNYEELLLHSQCH